MTMICEAPVASPTNLQQWFVLHTKSRQEKVLAADLSAMGIQYFLPLVEQVRFHGRRKVSIEMPMFPGYVFLRGTREEAFEADRTRRLARIIDVSDQDQIAWELKQISFALQQQAPLDPYPYLRNGLKVEVRAGPLRGLQGVIERRVRPDRLLLQIDMLGRAVGVEIDGALLDPME